VREFVNNEFRKFLLSVDRHLLEQFRVDLIGEAVAVLAFRVKSGTVDLDAVSNISPIEGALEAARKETNLEIAAETVGVYDAPYEYESRVKRLRIKGLKKLQIFVPEKHDWALIKITRLLEKDIEDIREVYGKVNFNRKVFLKRFLSEMTHVTGRREDLIFNFLSMMEELFGSKVALKMEKVIALHKNWKK
jgi:hypothetical protein